MKCPNDGNELKIADRQGIEIDYCPNCRGVWLDRGELDKIIERTAGMTGAAPFPPAQPQPDFGAPGYPQPGYGAPGYQQPGFGAPGVGYPQPGYQQPFYRQDDDDDDDDRRRYNQYPPGDPRYRRRKEGFLGDLFDFD